MDHNFTTGDIRFNVVNPNFPAIAHALQVFVTRGSSRSVVSISSLKIVSDNPTIPTSFSDIGTAISHGTKLFDALMYFSLPDNQRPTVRAADEDEIPRTRDVTIISKSVFYLAFFLITRAKVPSGIATNIGTSVPAFLQNILGMNETPDYYMNLLSSFDLSALNHTWIQYIQWSQVSLESMNRFGLGVAGYRSFQPFKLLAVKNDASVEAKRAAELAKAIATAPPDWKIHPITRDPNILTSLGNLNKNLGNLMLECFTQEQLDSLKSNRVIYDIPSMDVRHTNWRTWSTEMMPALTTPMFGPSNV
jgi:hypothetical protein